MTINVTQEHIKRGVRKNCGCCPVALALKEVIDVEYVIIGRSDSYYKKDGKIYHAEMPLIARQFIHNFDSCLEVKPFEFEVNFREDHDTF